MTIDIPMVAALSTAVVLVIGAIATGIVTVITALDHIKKEQAVAAVRMDTVVKDTEAIKGRVNSEKTAADGREALLREKIKMLEEMNADHKRTAALLAQSAAISSGKDNGGKL